MKYKPLNFILIKPGKPGKLIKPGLPEACAFNSGCSQALSFYKSRRFIIIIAAAFIILTALFINAEAARGVKLPAAETINNSAPFVVKIYPEDSEIDVALDTRIMATFNKKMREEDINEFSVTLNDGISDISTSVKYNTDLCKLIVSPLENLQPARSYFVTISRMVRDLNGTTMVSDKVWKFMTVKKRDKNPPVIVDVSPTVSAENVPCTAKIEVIFNKKMFEPSINENTITVKNGREKIIGSIRYYSDVNKAVFAPLNSLKPDSLFEVNISSEISDASRNNLSRAYNYTFKTSKIISAENSITDEINSAENEALIKNSKQAGVKYNQTSSDKFKKLVNIARKAGNSPEIENSDVNVLDDVEKPGYREKKIEIIEMFPAPGSDMINIDEKIKIKFNKRMNPGTFNIFNFALQDGEEYIFGKIEYNAVNNTAVFSPAGKLKMNRKYRVTISEKIEDIFGERLERDYSWEFTTIQKIVTTKIKDMFTTPDAGGKDILGPVITAISPRDNEENVSAESQITVTFNEAVKDFSINSFTFRVMDGETEVRGKIYYDTLQKKAIFTPAHPFLDGRAYTARITGGVMDLSGNYLQREKKWKFIVGKNWNRRSPSITDVTPGKGETDVDVAASINVQFDRPMKASTITPYSFFVTDGDKAVMGRVIYEQGTNRAIFAPWSTLAPNKIYNVTIAKTIQDIEGMTLAETAVWQFKTGNGFKSRITQSANVTSIAAENDANMQVALQKSMGSTEFNTTQAPPVLNSSLNTAISNNGETINKNQPEKTSLMNLVPVDEAAKRMSISDKSALGNVSAVRTADTTYNGELYADDAPNEMKNRYMSSDKGAYGNVTPERIKDTVDKTDIIDEAANETLKDQIAKFLSDDYKTSNKLASSIDSLPSVNTPAAEARTDVTAMLSDTRLYEHRNFIETPHEAAAAFKNTANVTIKPESLSTITSAAGGNEKTIYTRPNGIIESLERKNPGSVHVQMTEPPSKNDSIHAPDTLPNAPRRQPRLSDDGEGLIKLEKAEKYGEEKYKNPEFEDMNDGTSQMNANQMEMKNVERTPAAANVTPDAITPGGAAPSYTPGKINAFNPAPAPAPKGMINGVAVEDIIAQGGLDTISQSTAAANLKNGAPGETEGNFKNREIIKEKNSTIEFKKTGPGLSDVGNIPRDNKSNFFITAIYPNKNMANVKTDSTITAVFSQDIDASSINSESFIISGAESKINGKILYNQRMKKIIFRPAGRLKSGVRYDISLTTAVKSAAGQALLPLNWSFTTR